MILTDETLEQVRQMGALFLSPREIACLLDLDAEEFFSIMSDPSSDAYKTYLKGRTQSKMEIRTKVISLAKMGSPQAEMLAEKYIEENDIDQNV